MRNETHTRIIRGRWLFVGGDTPHQVIEDGALAVQGETIAAVDTWDALRARYPDAPVLGSPDHAVLPGLTNAHHHSSGVSSIQRGFRDQLLELWLLSLQRGRGGDRRLATQLAAARLLRSGVTCAVDVHSGHGTPEAFADSVARPLEAYEAAGIRVAFAMGLKTQSLLVWGDDETFLRTLPPQLQDLVRELRLPQPGDVDEDDYLAIFEDLHRRYADHPRIELWLAPPGPQWVSDVFLVRIAEAAEAYDTGIQTHLEESIYEKFYGPRTYGAPAVAHLHELGVLSPRLSFAHGVWLTEREIELLAESGAAVSHNPSSNLRLRAGIAPLNALQNAGVTVGLGMDGSTINDNEDMWQEMRLALRLHRPPQLGTPAPRAADVFRMATHGGAALMRAAGRRGKLAAGYQADVVVVDLARVTWPWVAPEADPLELLVYRAEARDVDVVLVGGRVVVEGGRVTTLDEEALGRELAAQLSTARRSEERSALVEGLMPHLERYYADWVKGPLVPYTVYNSRQ
jgi:cytosine/adenosine deaminase-related metal-dependent hydrolase